MLALTNETINIDGIPIKVYYYENPMSHEDCERLGLEYVDCIDNGNGEFGCLIFCEKGFKLEVAGYFLEKEG